MYNIIILLSIAVFIYYLYKISKLLTLEKYYTKSITFLSIYYPFLFCGCTLMAGFDDFTQWAFSAASVYYFLRKKYLWSSIFFLLALLCRETSIFLLSFYLFPYKISSFKIHKLYYFFAIVLFATIILQFGNNADAIQFIGGKRLYVVYENFYPIKAVWRTIVSFINVLGIPYLAFLLLKRQDKDNDYIKSILVFIVLNSLFSLLFSLVDESRIIGYPILFFIPYAGMVLNGIGKVEVEFNFNFIITILLAFLFCFFIYQPFESKSGIFYQLYAFLNILVIYGLYLYYRDTKEKATLNES